MPEPRTHHLLKSTALFCIGIDLLGAEIVITDISELGRQR